MPSGVPIYVDPIGLAEAKATITSPVALDLEGISLRTTLRLILRQVGLNYRVLDGLIYISSTHSIPEDGPIPQPAPKGPQAGIRQ